MNMLFKCFILILFVKLIGAERWRCDYNYLEKCGGWLKFHDIPMPFKEARLRCHYEGAQLASPTPELLDAMKDIIKKNDIPTKRVFTGIQALYTEWDFSSLEGTPISKFPHKWAEGEPEDDEGSCTTLNQYGTLAKVPCDYKYPFVCYKKKDGYQLNRCGTSDNSYVMFNKTGSCYKFHRNPHTWSRAYIICNAEGGHLAVINSEVEAQYMRDLLQENPESSLAPTGHKEGALVGVRDEDEHGEWITVQGQSLSVAGYDRFGNGQPDNYGGDQRCVQIDRKGVFDDVGCKSFYPFICEKDPNSLLCDDGPQY